MTADIMPGQAVRYGRTGTVGTVTRIEEIGGVTYGCIDTTDLLYRIDLLTPITSLKENKPKKVEKDVRQEITEERIREMLAAESARLCDDNVECGG
ncbi:MAG: DUF2098 domain-containing protein [Methanocalculus sp. MSAO_Arc2]|uniref:DUF2098 family protein n=1 Tax=Methanocalculus sp. MSAO_Arc2 TaxID=2293855 RepID=UPI000FF77E3C|nr:MAG: DUF2098 domain-containing protein [Methanocalculus sp. MSAO_Arc2]